MINKPKGILEPTQYLKFLMFSVNLVHQELSLPAGKVRTPNTAPVGRQPAYSKKAVPTSGKIVSGNQGSSSGSSRSVLPQITMGTAENIKSVGLGLLCPTSPLILSTGEQDLASIVPRLSILDFVSQQFFSKAVRQNLEQRAWVRD